MSYIYRFNSQWVVVFSGMPGENMRVGLGSTLDSAIQDLEITPFGSELDQKLALKYFDINHNHLEEVSNEEVASETLSQDSWEWIEKNIYPPVHRIVPEDACWNFTKLSNGIEAELVHEYETLASCIFNTNGEIDNTSNGLGVLVPCLHTDDVEWPLFSEAKKNHE